MLRQLKRSRNSKSKCKWSYIALCSTAISSLFHPPVHILLLLSSSFLLTNPPFTLCCTDTLISPPAYTHFSSLQTVWILKTLQSLSFFLPPCNNLPHFYLNPPLPALPSPPSLSLPSLPAGWLRAGSLFFSAAAGVFLRCSVSSDCSSSGSSSSRRM